MRVHGLHNGAHVPPWNPDNPLEYGLEYFRTQVPAPSVIGWGGGGNPQTWTMIIIPKFDPDFEII